MNKRSLFILPLFIFLLINIKAFSTTTINVNITQPVSVAACQENAFVATYISPGNHNLSIRAFLSVLGASTKTACDDSLIVKSNVFIVVTSVTNAIPSTYIVDTSYHDCFWKPVMSSISGDTVKIYYKVLIDCANLSGLANSNIVLNQTFADTTAVYAYHVSNLAPTYTLSISNVKTPYLLNGSPIAYNVYYLDTLSALFIYYNSGTADANISFQFYPDTINSCMASAISLEYADSLGGNFISFGSGSLTSAFIKTGKALVIRQKLKIDSCFQNCARDSVTLLWQCNLPLATGIFCTECQEAIGHHYDFNVSDNYSMDFILIKPVFPNPSVQWEHTCLNDTANMQEWVYRITKPNKGAIDTLHISINNFQGFPNDLALIKPSTFFIDGPCPSCHIDTTLYTTNLSLCNNLIGLGLDSASAIITKFGPDDTLYVHYKILRCAEENDPALLNKVKYFNTWNISVDPQNVCKDGDHFGDGSNSGELDLKLFFLPSVVDMSVPKGQLCGDISRFNVDMNGLADLYDFPITGLFGCDTATCVWQGYLKAKVHCDQNLRTINVDSSVYLQLFDTSSFTNLKRFPVYYNFGIDTTICEPGDYFFYFSLADSLTQQIIKHGQFSFELQACCGGEVGQSPYKISFYLLANPGDTNCINLSFVVDTPHVSFPDCSGLGCAWIPLSSVDDEIQVHCPGCKAPGIIVDKYDIRRTNFGLQDSDNDKRADNSLTQISDTSLWFKNYESRLSIHNSSYGDLLTDHLTAHFEPGSLPDGYTYPQMISSGAYLNDIQLYRTIPDAHDQLKLMVNDFTFYIDAIDNNYPNCIDCGEFGIDTNKYRTQLAINVSGNNIFQYFLDTLSPGGQFLFTFSSYHTSGLDTGNLHNPSMVNSFFNDTLNPFLTFFEGQHYRLKVNYKQCGMFPENGVDKLDFNTYLKKAKIFNKMALTGTRHSIPAFISKGQMPNTQALLDSIGYAVDTTAFPGDTLVNSIFVGSKLFFCETFTGIQFFFTDYILGNAGLYLEEYDCAIKMNGNGRDLIANNRYEVYPYEYRPAALAPIEFKFEIPPGFYVDSSFTRTDLYYNGFTKHSNYHQFTPPAITGTVTITPSDLPPLVCLTQQVQFNPGSGLTPTNPSDSNQYAGDSYTYRDVFLICKPFHCSDSSYQYNDTTIVVKIDTFPSSCFSLPTCGLEKPYKGITYVTGITDGKDVNVIPNLHLVDSTGHAYKEKFCTKIKLTNKDTLFSGYISNAAYNVFISIPDTALSPYLNGWTFNNVPFNSKAIIHVGSILKAGDSLVGNLCGFINQCHPDDNIKIYYGWNCNGYPETINPDSICFLDSIYIPFANSAATLISSGKSPTPHYNLCDTFIINVPYSANNAGGVRPDSVILTGIPSNLLVIDVLIGNPLGQTVSLSQSSANTWRISGNNLDTLGYHDTLLYSLPYPGMDVKIKAIAKCGYNGSSIGKISLHAHKFCGDTLIIQTTGSQYADSLNPQCSNCFTVTKTALTDTIGAFDTTGFIIVICGLDNKDSSYAYIDEFFPSDFTSTSWVPDSLLILPFSCDSFYVYGYFSTPGAASDHGHSNLIKITSNSGTVIDTATIGVSEPCALSVQYITRPDYDYISSYTLGGGSFTGDSLLVSGLLYIDQGLTLTNCKVYMASGSKIIIQSPYYLNLDNTFIIGCHAMWQGIYLEPGTAIDVTNNSLIADADTALYIPSIQYLGFKNSSLLNNVHGIYIEPSVGELKNFSADIYGSRFGMNDSIFKPDFAGQNPHGKIPFACIELNDIILDVGNGSKDSNYYYRANNGVIASRSISTLINNEFDSIQRDTAYKVDYRGTAIVGFGDKGGYYSHLTIEPLTGFSPTVHNSHRGVYTHYSSLKMDSTDLFNVRTGVYTDKCTGSLTTRVTNCKINAKLFGLRWRLNDGSSGMYASDNTITMSGDTTGTAISMQESGGISNYFISTNFIYLHDAKRGIWGQSVCKPVITFNRIYQNKISSTPLNYGIKLEKCDSAHVGCNYIANTDSSSQTTWGMYVNLSNYGIISCNTTTLNYKGVFFGGDCLNTAFKGNSMSNNFWGLELNTTAKIGKQDSSGNLWSNYRDTVGAVNFNNSTLLKLQASEFDVNTSMPSTYFPQIPSWDAGWFFITSGTPFSCNTSSPCEDWTPPADEANADYLRAVANNEDLTVDFIPESKNMAEQNLFDRLSKNSALLASDTIFSEFYNQNVNDNIGKMHQVKESLKSISSYDSITDQVISSAYKSMNNYIDSLHVLDSLSKVNPQTNYSSQQDVLIISVNSIQDTITDISLQQQNSMEQIIDSATTINNSYTPNELPEYNEQFITKLFALYLKYGADTLFYFYEDLLAIAQQCPYSGGGAVYKARTFVGYFNDTIEYDDQSTCYQAGFYRQGNIKPQLISQSEIKIIPNPADQKITIVLKNATLGICKIEILNALGSLVLSDQMNCKEKNHDIDTKKFKPGVYTLKVYGSSFSTQMTKLVISR